MVTDKNKINFNNWYNKIFLKKHGSVSLPLFYSYTFEMQIGVYLAYYKEVHGRTLTLTILTAKDILIEIDELINQQHE